MADTKRTRNDAPTNGRSHKYAGHELETLAVPAGLSHICDAARIPHHPDNRAACNALAAYVWDRFMHGPEEVALHAAYTVTSMFDRKEGGLDG